MWLLTKLLTPVSEKFPSQTKFGHVSQWRSIIARAYQKNGT